MMFPSSCISQSLVHRCRLSAVVLAMAIFVSQRVEAQEVATDESQRASPEASSVIVPPADDTQPADVATSCKDEPPNHTWLDRLQEKLSEVTCSSASWVDGLFATRQERVDYRSSYGELFVGGAWSQQDQVDKVLRFRAHLNLPYARNRMHAFIGRVDRNEFVTESVHELHALPLAFDRNIKNSVLLGLGYEEPLKKYGAFDADIGMPIDWPADPYAKSSYRLGFPLGDNDLVRLRETVFWQKSEHFGTTTRADWDRVISDNHLLRWTASITRSQLIDGSRWYSTLTWYQMFNAKHAMAYELAANRNSYHVTSVDDYGFTAIYRQNIWRSWLWLEVRAGIDWPYQIQTNERRSNLLGLIAFEMRYGGQQ
jgi:hypothetical protein